MNFKKSFKIIIAILIITIFNVQAFAWQAPPVIGVGVVVKRNPGTGGKVTTGKDGKFSMQLTEGEYTLSLDKEQLQIAINGLIKKNYQATVYKFDGSGVQLTLDRDTKIQVQGAGKELMIKMDKEFITLTVPKGGAMLSATLTWNDEVMSKSVAYPWLDNKTGSIKYFQYDNDYTISAPQVCKDLGVNSIVIQKGTYAVMHASPDMGGKIVFDLKVPIPISKILNSKSRGLQTYICRDKDCGGFGNSCWYTTKPLNEKDVQQTITVTPIIEKGQCIKMEVQYRGAGAPKSQGF